MLTVPEPLPNDPEAVVTALETAEIFGKQGDVKEAVRWVRRAAEIAGDEGIDERALTLARAVADLNISTSRMPEAPPPPPPPLPGGSAPPASRAPTQPAADDTDSDAETRVVNSGKLLAEFERNPPGQGNGAAEQAPAHIAGPSAAAVAAAVDLTTDAVESPAKDVEEPTPASKRGVGSMAELLARKEAEVSSARAAAEAAQPADTSWDDPPPPPPAQPTLPPVERRTARPLGERIPTPLIPSSPHTERPPVQAPIHQAVRASVVATAEPGVYVLRVLTEGQPPAPTAHEVFVVAMNPNSSPFR